MLRTARTALLTKANTILVTRRLRPLPTGCVGGGIHPMLATRWNSSGGIPPTAKNAQLEKDGTDPDFQPQIPTATTMDVTTDMELIKKDMRETIATEDIVLFIKGLPESPVCGFSRKIVDIMDLLAVEYTSFDVLAHPIVRSYVKELSNWPTIPQLFVKGEFVGGADLIVEMAKNGGLQLLLEKHGINHRPSKVRL
jgi:monothiol glutaredoxin